MSPTYIELAEQAVEEGGGGKKLIGEVKTSDIIMPRGVTHSNLMENGKPENLLCNTRCSLYACTITYKKRDL